MKQKAASIAVMTGQRSSIPRQISLRQIIRFCIVGASCYIVTLGVLTGLCELAGMHYVAAFVIAFLIGNVLGYQLNGRYTFAQRESPIRPSLSRYVIVNCVLLVLNSVLLTVFVEIFGIWYVVATIILSILNIPVSFLAHRTLSYGISREASSG